MWRIFDFGATSVNISIEILGTLHAMTADDTPGQPVRLSTQEKKAGEQNSEDSEKKHGQLESVLPLT